MLIFILDRKERKECTVKSIRKLSVLRPAQNSISHDPSVMQTYRVDAGTSNYPLTNAHHLQELFVVKHCPSLEFKLWFSTFTWFIIMILIQHMHPVSSGFFMIYWCQNKNIVRILCLKCQLLHITFYAKAILHYCNHVIMYIRYRCRY